MEKQICSLRRIQILVELTQWRYTDIMLDESIKKRPHHTLLKQQKSVDEAVDQMIDTKIMEWSRSPQDFPVALERKDRRKRFCVDFRALNQITKNNAPPPSVNEDILSVKYFSKLDLKTGYWQVQLQKEDKEKRAFTCFRSLFYYNVLSFGLSSSPAVFQELMSVILH